MSDTTTHDPSRAPAATTTPGPATARTAHPGTPDITVSDDVSASRPGASHAAGPTTFPAPGADRARKFRQAAFTYLHIGILYEATAIVFWRQGLFPEGRGPEWLWLALGAAVIAVVVWGLGSWRNVWFARAVWAIHALRLPTMISGAFFPDPDPALPPTFFLAALVAVVINLWMLARAAWDV